MDKKRFLPLIALFIFLALSGANCTFSGSGCSSAGNFAGCFESGDFGGSNIQVGSGCFPTGVLLLGQPEDPGFRSYAFSAEVKTFPSNTVVGVFELMVIESFPATARTDQITALLATDDTVSVVIPDEAPIGPMTRCAQQ